MGKPYSMYGSAEKLWSLNVTEETTQKHLHLTGLLYLTFNVLAFKRPQPPAGRSFSGI